VPFRDKSIASLAAAASRREGQLARSNEMGYQQRTWGDRPEV